MSQQLARGWRDEKEECSHLKELRSKHRPPAAHRVPLIQPGKRRGKTPEGGDIGGPVGTYRGQVRRKGILGAKTQGEGSMVFAKPPAAWHGRHTRSEKELYGTVSPGAPSTHS